MTLRQYLTIMTLSTAMCWVSWSFVIKNVDPFTDSSLGFFFFYLSFFFALIGTGSLLGFLVLHLFGSKDVLFFRRIQQSFFIGLTTGVVLMALLYLQGSQILGFWNFIIFLSIVLFFILFQLSLRFERSHRK